MDCASRSLVAAALLNSLGRTPEKSPFAAHSQAELVALVSSLSKPHLIEILGRLDEPSLRGLLVRSIEAAAPKSGAACPVCRKEFASVGRLNAHMVGHSSARSFKCLVCHKGTFYFLETLLIFFGRQAFCADTT